MHLVIHNALFLPLGILHHTTYNFSAYDNTYALRNIWS